MTRYAVFLRGINVGGINIKMADLRRVIEGLGFTDVRTVLASGNVLLDADETDTAVLKADIEAALRREFHYEAWVFVLDLAAVRKIVDQYPFQQDREGWHSYAVIVDNPNEQAALLSVADQLEPGTERIQGGDGVVYWEVERGSTVKSTFGKNAGKPKMRSVTTTRNLRTLHKMLA